MKNKTRKLFYEIRGWMWHECPGCQGKIWENLDTHPCWTFTGHFWLEGIDWVYNGRDQDFESDQEDTGSKGKGRSIRTIEVTFGESESGRWEGDTNTTWEVMDGSNSPPPPVRSVFAQSLQHRSSIPLLTPLPPPPLFLSWNTPSNPVSPLPLQVLILIHCKKCFWILKMFC